MTRTSKLRVVMAFAVALSVAFTTIKAFAADGTAKSISFATALIEPYQTLNENGELGGLSPPIVSCVMNALAIDFTIEVLPWARAQKNVELGVHDAFFVASRNEVRDRYATSSKPLFSGKRSWVFRPGYDADPEADEFKRQARVASIFGTNMHSYLEANYSNVVGKRLEQELYELLEAGRLDAILVTNAMYDHMLASNQDSTSVFIARPHASNPLGIYFGNKFLANNPRVLDEFNSALPGCVTDL